MKKEYDFSKSKKNPYALDKTANPRGLTAGSSAFQRAGYRGLAAVIRGLVKWK